jgi:hypothetical protein
MQIARNNTDQYIIKPPQNQFFDFNQVCVPSLYIVLPQAGWEVTVVEEEATDREILRCLEKSGHLDFLDDPEEDTYRLGDGEPV